MELTRRDALAALAAAGAGIGAYAASDGAVRAPTADRAPDDPGSGSGDPPGVGGDDLPDVERVPAVLSAVAPVVYPSAVEGHREFVETYALGRIRGREAYREGVRGAVADLDDAARAWHDRPYPDLGVGTRESVLRELGADRAGPDPEGSIAERVRYYVVDELLYALYASPAGGRLVGNENPPGHPGGIESYRRGPGEAENYRRGPGDAAGGSDDGE